MKNKYKFLICIIALGILASVSLIVPSESKMVIPSKVINSTCIGMCGSKPLQDIEFFIFLTVLLPLFAIVLFIFLFMFDKDKKKNKINRE